MKGQILGSQEFGFGSVRFEVLIGEKKREEEEQGFWREHISRICVTWQR